MSCFPQMSENEQLLIQKGYKCDFYCLQFKRFKNEFSTVPIDHHLVALEKLAGSTVPISIFSQLARFATGLLK